MPAFLPSLRQSGAGGRIHRTARLVAWEQPVFRFIPATIDPQQLQKLGGEHHLPGKLPLAFPHVDQHALTVDVGDFELLRFGNRNPVA